MIMNVFLKNALWVVLCYVCASVAALGDQKHEEAAHRSKEAVIIANLPQLSSLAKTNPAAMARLREFRKAASRAEVESLIVPTVRQGLSSTNPFVQHEAVYTAIVFTNYFGAFLDGLLPIAKSDNIMLAAVVLEAISGAPRSATNAVLALTEIYKTGNDVNEAILDRDPKALAAMALFKIGAIPPEAISIAKTRLLHHNPYVRLWAGLLLLKTETDFNINDWARSLLNDPDPDPDLVNAALGGLNELSRVPHQLRPMLESLPSQGGHGRRLRQIFDKMVMPDARSPVQK